MVNVLIGVNVMNDGVFKSGRMLMICVCERYGMKVRKFGHYEITTSSNFIPAILE